jgi:hypothetical protein
MNADRARRALWRLMRSTEGAIDSAARDAAREMQGASDEEILALVKESAQRFGKEMAALIIRRLSTVVGLGAQAAFSVLGESPRDAAAWIRQNEDSIIARFSPRVQLHPLVIARGLREVETAMRLGEGAQQAAYRMRDVARVEPTVQVAQLARRTADAARQAVLAAGPAAQDKFGVEVARLQRHARTLGRDMGKVEGYSMRGTTLETVARMRDAVERMRPDLIEQAAKWHVYHKVAYHERMTARTEMNLAYQGAFVQSAKDLGATRVRWVLNQTRHEIGCECEDVAMGHSIGCPPGVYLTSEVPEAPHPNCLCYVEYVVE